MIPMVCIIVCAIAYAIKGGSGNVFKNWDYVREKSKLLDVILDGKVLSTIIVLLFTLMASADIVLAIFCSIAWLIAVSPSMGEEHGAVGDYKEFWGPYIEKGFGREYGIKKALQRGAWMGASFTLFTGSVLFLVCSLLFVPCIFIGQSLNRIILKKRGWTLAEPLIGGIIFGIPLGALL